MMTSARADRPMRRGLPRVAGGEPWPVAETAATASAPTASVVLDEPAVVPDTVPEPASAAPPLVTAAPGDRDQLGGGVRRGLPRVPGGAPWPDAAVVPAHRAPASAASSRAEVPEAIAVTPVGERDPLAFPRSAWPGRAQERSAHASPRRIGRFTRGQWVLVALVGGVALLYAVAMTVLAARWLVSTEPVTAFLDRFPGEYPLPDGAPVGLPAWLGWQHFFNVFLMVLIIRSGLQVRREKRPSMFWTPRWNRKRKMSIALWFHQSLDLLWVLNGLAFVVLLFATGQWMRVVPTSWEVFPNALSALVQYVSLDWPTENGWVNYNSLQQLAYFATIFLAAPLAALTGVRMSGLWPKNSRVNRFFPLEWARAVHFPVMLYFVAFIVVHVALVLATGALRNLNHMYAAQDAVNWTGFWVFVASIAIIVAGWIAARPVVLAGIARAFGKVSGR